VSAPAALSPDARAAAARALVAPFAAEYPFAPRFLDVGPGALHYVDEGPRDAAPLLCLHGNPSWSFLYRRLARELRDRHRVVAPDHLGCGLSDKPQGWSYRLADHVANLERLVEALDLRDITLVVHDWGGAIGFGMATRHPERVARLVILNTAAFPEGRMPLRIALCRTPVLGEALIRRCNAFALAAVRMAVVKHERMTPVVRRGFLAPYADAASRIAHWRFVQDIPMSPRHPSYATLEEIDAGIPRLADRPAAIYWGERDFCFTPAFRRMWERRLPGAEVHGIEDAGHYVLEDAHERILPWLRDFLARS
jgi:haloalkane dehalogenase